MYKFVTCRIIALLSDSVVLRCGKWLNHFNIAACLFSSLFSHPILKRLLSDPVSALDERCKLAVIFPQNFSGMGDSADNTTEENSSVFSLIRMRWLPSARACRQYNCAPTKTSSVLNWRCRLVQVDLYNGCKTVVVSLAANPNSGVFDLLTSTVCLSYSIASVL